MIWKEFPVSALCSSHHSGSVFLVKTDRLMRGRLVFIAVNNINANKIIRKIMDLTSGCISYCYYYFPITAHYIMFYLFFSCHWTMWHHHPLFYKITIRLLWFISVSWNILILLSCALWDIMAHRHVSVLVGETCTF